MRDLTRSATALLATVGVLAACGGQRPQNDQEPASVAAEGSGLSLAAAQDIGVRNAAMPAPNLLTSGQVTEDQLQALADMGYSNFISLRVPTEQGAGWEEAFVSEGDVAFSRIPISGADDLTRENVEALAGLLEEASAEGTVLYCGSSNRVGALLALKAYWLDGAEPEEALALGRAAGMSRLEGRVTELLAEPR